MITYIKYQIQLSLQTNCLLYTHTIRRTIANTFEITFNKNVKFSNHRLELFHRNWQLPENELRKCCSDTDMNGFIRTTIVVRTYICRIQSYTVYECIAMHCNISFEYIGDYMMKLQKYILILSQIVTILPVYRQLF